MTAKITLTPAQMLLLELLISAAITAATQQVLNMTPEEVDIAIEKEKVRHEKETGRLYARQ